MKYYIKGLKKYAIFEGRATRSEFWYFMLFYYIIMFVVGFISGVMDGLYKVADDNIAFDIIVYIFAFANIIPFIAVCVRRLHDTGRNGWYCLIPIYSWILCCYKSDKGMNKYGPQPYNTKVSKSNSTNMSIDDLGKLAKLKEQGHITESEFEEKKKQILKL